MNKLRPISELVPEVGKWYMFSIENDKDAITFNYLLRYKKENEWVYVYLGEYLEKKGRIYRRQPSIFTHFHEYTPPELTPFIKHPIELYDESMGCVMAYNESNRDFAYRSQKEWYNQYGVKLEDVGSGNPTHFMIIND